MAEARAAASSCDLDRDNGEGIVVVCSSAREGVGTGAGTGTSANVISDRGESLGANSDARRKLARCMCAAAGRGIEGSPFMPGSSSFCAIGDGCPGGVIFSLFESLLPGTEDDAETGGEGLFMIISAGGGGARSGCART